MVSTTDYLLWRLGFPDKYSAVAYSAPELATGSGPGPKYFVLDKAIYGPEGSEADDHLFWIQTFDQDKGISIGEADTLIEGIRKAEDHWLHRTEADASQQD